MAIGMGGNGNAINSQGLRPVVPPPMGKKKRALGPQGEAG